jgi:hypothetical protein
VETIGTHYYQHHHHYILNIYATVYQKNVGNYLLDLPRVVYNLLGGKEQGIDILRNFEGYALVSFCISYV